MAQINDPEVTVCTIDDALDLYACAVMPRVLGSFAIPMHPDSMDRAARQAWELAQHMQRTRPRSQELPNGVASSPAGDVHTARALLAEVSRTAQLTFDGAAEHMTIEATGARISVDLLSRIRDYLLVAGGI